MKTKDINLNQPLIFSNQATLGGVKGAKQALALALDTIRVTNTIFEGLDEIKGQEIKLGYNYHVKE